MRKILVLLLLPIVFTIFLFSVPKQVNAAGAMGGIYIKVVNANTGAVIPGASITVAGNIWGGSYSYDFLDGASWRSNNCNDAAFVYDYGNGWIDITNSRTGTTGGDGLGRLADGYAGSWSQRNHWGISCTCNNYTVWAWAPGYYQNSALMGLSNTDNGFQINLTPVPVTCSMSTTLESTGASVNTANDTDKVCVNWSTTGGTAWTYNASGSTSGTYARFATGASGSSCAVRNTSKGSSRTFSIEVSGPGGATSCSKTLAITNTTTPTCSITQSPSPVVLGSNTSLTVTSQNALKGVFGLDGESYSSFDANSSWATMQVRPNYNGERMYARVFKTQSDIDAYMGNYSQWYNAAIVPANSGICYIDMNVTIPNSCPTLTVTPTSVRQGDSAKLAWSGGQGVQSFDVKQQIGSGTPTTVYANAQNISSSNLDVVPSVTTNYLLDVLFADGTRNPDCTLVKVPVTVRPYQSGSDRDVPPN